MPKRRGRGRRKSRKGSWLTAPFTAPFKMTAGLTKATYRAGRATTKSTVSMTVGAGKLILWSASAVGRLAQWSLNGWGSLASLVGGTGKTKFRGQKRSLSVSPVHRVRRIIVDGADIDNMDGHDFEHYVAALLPYQGFFDIEVTKASNDWGADIIAHYGNLRYAIQVKRWSKPVSDRAIYEAKLGSEHYGCNAIMVVTNTTFTSDAINYAQQYGCVLVDGDELYRWVADYKAGQNNSARTGLTFSGIDDAIAEQEGDSLPFNWPAAVILILIGFVLLLINWTLLIFLVVIVALVRFVSSRSSDAPTQAYSQSQPNTQLQIARRTPRPYRAQRKCLYCGRINPFELHTCSGCGASLPDEQFDPMRNERSMNVMFMYQRLGFRLTIYSDRIETLEGLTGGRLEGLGNKADGLGGVSSNLRKRRTILLRKIAYVSMGHIGGTLYLHLTDGTTLDYFLGFRTREAHDIIVAAKGNK